MSPAEQPPPRGVTRGRVSNLHEGLLRGLTADHGGLGTILAHRAYSADTAPGPIAFIDLVVLPPGTSIGVHRHTDNEETYVILAGRGLMTLDGQQFAVRPGDVVPNLPYGQHGLANISDNDLQLLVFEVGPLGGRA
ncbi:cupin domain-containing protein [Kitasatospora purpeofusca]|uniref:cupin domain-containing protein n=1 Tax=Kitasatospora purpeofusca TaxID=67352 RepID=UPI0033D4EBAB